MSEAKGDLTMKKFKAAAVVGGIGGLFWSLVGYVAFFLHFTVIGPSVWIKPFVKPSFAEQIWAHLMGVGVGTLLSIGLALIYVFTLSRYYQPWVGIFFGLILFGIVYYAVSPLLQLTKKPIHLLGINTFSTELCLFVLYGLFVGFSLSSEFSSQEEGG